MRTYLLVIVALNLIIATGKAHKLLTKAFPIRQLEYMSDAAIVLSINIGLGIWAGILLWVV